MGSGKANFLKKVSQSPKIGEMSQIYVQNSFFGVSHRFYFIFNDYFFARIYFYDVFTTGNVKFDKTFFIALKFWVSKFWCISKGQPNT